MSRDYQRPNVALMLGQRRRRWTNIKPALRQCIVFREVTDKDAMPQNTIKDLDELRFWIQ